MGVFVMLGMKTEEQNRARKGMIAELAHANQRLEEMMRRTPACRPSC